MSASRMLLQALPQREAAAPATSGGLLEVVAHDKPHMVEALWRRLEADRLSSLHQGFDWCRAWMRTNPEQTLILEGRLDRQPAFLLPLAISRKRGIRVARFIATGYSNINTGLFTDPPPLMPGLAQALRSALQGKADLLSMENMPLSWRERISPFSMLPHTENQNRAFQLPLLASFEETLKQVNAKRRRKKFRLQQRKLEEAGGYEIRRANGPAEKHALLTEFFRQKAERFRSHGLPDVFRDKPVQDFFHALAEVPEQPDNYALALHGLYLKGEHDGVVLAIAGTSRKGDHVICQFGSIREDLLPEASPGEFLFWHVIEAACRDGAALFDFGIGDQTYKRSWCTVETVQYDVLVPVTMKGVVAATFHRATVKTKAAIKANPRLYAAVQKFRAAGSAGAVRDESESD